MAGGVLGMTTMLFADEVVPPEKLDELPDTKLEASASEIKMARQLIESLSADFEPGKYRDEYREAVLDMIDRKAEGQEISVQAEDEEEVERGPRPDGRPRGQRRRRQGARRRRQAQGSEEAGRRSRRPRPRPRSRRPRSAPRPRPRSRRACRRASAWRSRSRAARLSLSNLDKVLYPETGFTKGQVIDYYTRIAPVLLPHLRGRALTMKRYPNGVEEKYFYEKQRPKHAPEWVESVSVEGHRDGRVIDYILADDLPTLVWLANMADLEMHPSLALAEDTAGPRCSLSTWTPARRPRSSSAPRWR